MSWYGVNVHYVILTMCGFHPLAGDKVKDAWRGAALWSQGSSKQYFISKADYSEKGHEYLKPHFASNAAPSPSSISK